jgi:hypothetical protein
MFLNHFRWRPELILTHESRLLSERIDRSIIPESYIELSLAVLEIIRGKNYFFKKGNRRHLRTGSVIFKNLQIIVTSYILVSSCQKLSNFIKPSLRNGWHKKFTEMVSFSAKTESSYFNFRSEQIFLIIQKRLNVLIKILFWNWKVEV